MIWLSSSTVARLRDQLRDRARAPSKASASSPSDAAGEAKALEWAMGEYGPICEAMFLMMSADGTVSPEERDVLAGALRNLSGDAVLPAHVDALLDAASGRVGESGRDASLQRVVQQLRGDPARAEVAFVLAAAIAFADSAIADEENEALNRLAEGLGIDETRAESLLVTVEADLAER
jgi:tellurite resistance protein